MVLVCLFIDFAWLRVWWLVWYLFGICGYCNIVWVIVLAGVCWLDCWLLSCCVLIVFWLFTVLLARCLLWILSSIWLLCNRVVCVVCYVLFCDLSLLFALLVSILFVVGGVFALFCVLVVLFCLLLSGWFWDVWFLEIVCGGIVLLIWCLIAIGCCLLFVLLLWWLDGSLLVVCYCCLLCLCAYVDVV